MLGQHSHLEMMSRLDGDEKSQQLFQLKDSTYMSVFPLHLHTFSLKDRPDITETLSATLAHARWEPLTGQGRHHYMGLPQASFSTRVDLHYVRFENPGSKNIFALEER